MLHMPHLASRCCRLPVPKAPSGSQAPSVLVLNQWTSTYHKVRVLFWFQVILGHCSAYTGVATVNFGNQLHRASGCVDSTPVPRFSPSIHGIRSLPVSLLLVSRRSFNLFRFPSSSGMEPAQTEPTEDQYDGIGQSIQDHWSRLRGKQATRHAELSWQYLRTSAGQLHENPK